MQPVSALLRVLAALIGTLVAAGLAVLAALLLLLAALFFVAVRLRFLFIRLVGGVSHFPSPFAAQNIILRHWVNPPGGADVPPLVAFPPGRGGCATRSANIFAAAAL
jgi:hypothetical protein